MKKVAKKIICIMLAFILAVPVNLMQVRAEMITEDVIFTLTPDVVTETEENYFKYTSYSDGPNWAKFNTEAYIDLGSGDARAEECFYEIYFTGKAISVYATKRDTHGKVKFTVDGEEEQIVDLYSTTRINEAEVYTVNELEYGHHVLKAVTLNEKTGSKVVNQVNYARITGEVQYDSEQIGRLGGTIADTDTQYTQNRYSEVVAKNVFSQNLTAWKNDKAVSEIVLFSRDGRLEDVTVTAGPLKNGDSIIGTENITTTFIKSTKAYNGAYLGYGAGNTNPVPEETPGNRSESSDILYQRGGSIDIARNSLQPVWVEYSIPKDAKEGIYQGVISVSAKDIDKPVVFQYTVEVQNEVLPEEETFGESFDIELWQYPYSSAEYYGVEPFSDEHLEILKPIMLKYKEIGGHAITTTISEEAWNAQTYSANEIHYPSMVKWTKEEDGSFSYDYTVFDKWVAFCKSLGIGDKIVLYSIAPWHGSFTYWENGELKKEGYSAGNDRYNQVWGDFLRDLTDHLDTKNWFDDAYIGIDERGFNTAAFDLIDTIKNKDNKSLKTAGAMDGFVDKKDLAMRVDDLNVGDTAAAAHPDEFQTLLQEREAAGLRTTLYSCTEHKPGNFSLSIPAESYWSIVNAGKFKTAGFLRWAYDAWVEDPLRDTTHNAFEPGDCFSVFPDEKDAEHPECKSSVRLERMAEGLRDINKLRLIEKNVPALADDITELYNGIATRAQTGQTYLSDAQKTTLVAEMRAFKEGIADITRKYLKETGRPGLYVSEDQKELTSGEQYTITSNLSSTQTDKTIIYKSSDPAVASVNKSGTVTADRAGKAVITLWNKASGYKAEVEITVTKTNRLPLNNTLTDYKLPDSYLSDIDIDRDNERGRKYLGQPDMVMLDDEKTLITIYPVGHGVGPAIMQISRDGGETWTEKTDAPESWKTSYETPTIYKLNMTDGTTKLIVISGRPASFGAKTGGWDSSVSTDGGETWTEYERYCETFADGSRVDTTVAMASLVQLKDPKGNDIDKWMGVFHDGASFVNYKTYLTFDEEGNQQWTTPVPYLSEYRSIESSRAMCEIGMFRSPDGKRIVGLARNQNHNNYATMIYSDDEGETWSKPQDLPGSLAGERHKIMYDPTDPTGQTLIITFREIKYFVNESGAMTNWLAGDWIAWVGTYDDIMNQHEGRYRILLCEDWSNNAKSGDTGYAGLVVQSDGTFIMDSYGHWDKEVSQAHVGDIRKDLCWIKQAKFKLSDLDEVNSLAENVKSSFMDNVDSAIEQADQYESSKADYTAESWKKVEDAKARLQELKNSANAENTSDYFAALSSLNASLKSLVLKGADELEELENRVPVSGVVISPITKDLKRGTTRQLTATVLPNYADNKEVTWNTSDPAVATVSKDGLVTATGEGTVRITATADGYPASMTIDVFTTMYSVTFDAAGGTPVPAKQNVKSGDKVQKPQNPVKKGYTFAGWFTDSEGKKAYDFNAFVQDDIKLYAKWIPVTEKSLKDGDIKSVGSIDYRVESAADHTVIVYKGKSKNDRTVKILSTVDIDGISCKVIGIGDKAFQNYKKLKKVTIGENVTAIGKNAFSGCKKLKTVILEGSSIQTVKSCAFKKTSSNMTVKAKKMQKSQKKKLLKKLKKAGISKKTKMK